MMMCRKLWNNSNILTRLLVFWVHGQRYFLDSDIVQTVGLQEKYPNLTGRIVLQDVFPALLDKAIVGPKVEKMQYDYLTEQPIKGK